MGLKMIKAITGGAVGTAVMTFMMYFVRPKLVGAPMDIGAELGSQMGGSWALGMFMHVLIGVVFVPVILSKFLADLLPGPSVVKGLIVGLAMWLLAMTVMMPMMGKGMFLTGTGEGPKAIVASLMAHSAYGLLLGKIAAFGSQKETSEI